MSEKPNCYECKHRRPVPGDAHSSCKHPDIKPTGRGELLAILGGLPDHQAIEAAAKLRIQANEHGVRNGWFAWPYNFDPVWLIHCNGFEEKS